MDRSASNTRALKIELAIASFFAIPLKAVEIEAAPATGRVYYVYNGRIVAVAMRWKEDFVHIQDSEGELFCGDLGRM